MHKLYVCQTCKRDEPLDPGAPSRGARLLGALTEALEAASLDSVLVVRVACLNGCLHPCNVSMRAPRKYALRLSSLDERDAPAVVRLLRTYIEHESGDVADAQWPDGLRERMSACVPPPHLLGR